ncbi:MAG: carboxylesterase/lipase family protein [Lysobacterales bacterium]
MRRLLLAALLLISLPLRAEVEAGLWYDRYRNGHGLDLHRAGPLLFGTFYTFTGTGASEWLWLQSEDLDAPSSTLTRFRQAPGGVVGSPAGQISLTPTTSCADGLPREGAQTLLRMDFNIGNYAASWCLEPLLPADGPAMDVVSGVWYAPDDSGWGIATRAFRGANNVTTQFRLLYAYDGDGNPRWSFALDNGDALTQNQTWYLAFVECTGCPISPPLTHAIGTSTLTLTQPLALTDPARNRINVSVQFETSAPFQRERTLSMLSDPLRVRAGAATGQGPVAGEILADGIEVFRNLPYARSPIGALRWRAPQALAPRGELRSAQSFGPACPQRNLPPENQSEDCLQLNVWRPPTPGPHPVMVWIHGGGFIEGSAVQQYEGRALYDGAVLAAKNTVFVSLNYRLGALGFMAQRNLIGEAPDQPQSGNYGLLDQIAALQWVQDNIAAFGGDPNRVTLFGESAGGISTCALLTAPAARGLFHRAIVQSGICDWQLRTLEQGLQQGDLVVSSLGCAAAADRASCLRGLAATDLVVGEAWGPVQDGFVLSQSPGRALAEGTAAQLPLLIGVTDDESTSLVPLSQRPTTAADYQSTVQTLFPTIAAQVLQQYPLANYASPERAWLDLLDDRWFTCTARRAAADHAAHGNAVYHYVLSEILPDMPALESFHGLDVLLLFAARNQPPESEFRAGARLRGAWVDFAYGREPGLNERLLWPPYQAGSRQSLEINGGISHLINDYHGDRCQFWAQFETL